MDKKTVAALCGGRASNLSDSADDGVVPGEEYKGNFSLEHTKLEGCGKAQVETSGVSGA